MKNKKERIGYFWKMILVFPEAFLAKLTKPKSRGEFDDTASAVAGLFLIVSLMSLSILFFVNWLTSYGGKNEGTFSDGVFSEYRGFYLFLSLSVAFFFVKSLLFAGSRGYSDFLSECTLREKKETTLFDDENEQNISEVIIIMFPEHQKENGDKENEISTKETMDVLKTYRFRGKKGIVILKKGKAESRKNVDNISVEKIYANDDVEKFNQKARYRIKKIELLKETTIFTLWNMEYKKESRQLLVTVEGNIAEDVLEELKAKAMVQEELDSMLN